ncbi:helix-turn-helix domain-containing protein [Brevibacillus formosus]|uniref:helix-turn-helix domain-containing protein n=1 Tax=Brevibacillus formosus TaxID=54913 RepID=UPI0018CF4A6D|nr:helix-turn-helix domain-containing protein [Brevibacillus formosus]MBG9940567.1 hypothetical protein [Brevibacillus formosus]
MLQLKELVLKAQRGDGEALMIIINQFTPAIKKHARNLGYEDAEADLKAWACRSIMNYKIRSTGN